MRNHGPDLQPTLVGERVVVRPIALSDWQEMFEAAADPEIWAAHPVSDRYTEPVFRKFFDSAIESRSAFSFVDRASGRIIGSSRYHDYDREKREVEIGWTFLSRAYWGGSFNREIKTLMLEHAFGFADTVIFLVGETNFRSRRAMEKIGGVLRDEKRDRVLNGRRYSHVIYEICKQA